MLYRIDELIDFGVRALVARGVDPGRAGRIARVQVEIEAFGVKTHGLKVLNSVIRDLGGKIDPQRVPTQVHDRASIAAFDGKGCVGVECIMLACDEAARRAREHGLAFVSVLDTEWVGALGYHLAQFARDGFMAMAWAQMPGLACVAPFGGREGRLSTNPMALSFPGDPNPVVADFSTAATSNGKVGMWLAGGHRPPEPLMLDADGVPTDDPAVVRNGGTILPFGGRHYGFRGTALAMWIEALTVAAGGRAANAKKQGGQNAHVLAMDIGHMHGAGEYGPAMHELLQYVLSSAPADGSRGPVMAGDREWAALAQARERGVELDDHLVGKMEEFGRELGIEVPTPLCED